jgi:hypothetical protein
MKVELLIADDRELRASIHEMIRAEVLNMARKELKDIIASAIESRLPSDVAAEKVMTTLFEEEVRRQVKDTLGGHRSNYNDPTFIQRMAREEVRMAIRELMKNGNAI